MMRVFLLLALSLAMGVAAAAQAQENAPVTISPRDASGDQNSPSAASRPDLPPAVIAPRPRRGLRQRFEEANTTHDGRLTPEQAQAAWPMVAKHFAEIDKDRRGYVTIDDIRLYRLEHRRRNRMPGPDTGESSEAPGLGASVGGKPATEAPDTEK